VALAVRRVNVTGRVVETTIPVTDPIAVASAGGSIWVASGSTRAIGRIDPEHNTVVQTIQVRGRPSALAADTNGVWVAVS
jgi:DNA-binding beta-propeller fold protein YncE